MKAGDLMNEMKTTQVTTYLLSKDERPCCRCGKLTNQIEIYTESRFCSDSCTNEFYRTEVDKAESL